MEGSKNRINDETPFKNNLFLDLPYRREIFVNPKTSARADIYKTRKNTEMGNKIIQNMANALQEQGNGVSDILGDIKKSQDIYGRGIADLISSNYESIQRYAYDTNHTLNSGFDRLQDGFDNLSGGLNNLAEGMEDGLNNIGQMLMYVYGSHVIEHNSIDELLKKYDILRQNGRKTLISLFVIGGIDEQKMTRIFSPAFIKYLKTGVASHQASKKQYELIENINKLHQLKNSLYEEIKTQNESKSDAIVKKNQDLKKELQNIDKEIMRLESYCISNDEIKFLDIGNRSRQVRSISQMIERGYIAPDILEILLRNGQIALPIANQIADVIVQDENEYLKPLFELDGITGVLQQAKIQRLLGNIAIKQNETSNAYLQQIDADLLQIGQKFDIQNQSLTAIDTTLTHIRVLQQESNQLSILTKEAIVNLKGDLSRVLLTLGDRILEGNQMQIDELHRIQSIQQQQFEQDKQTLEELRNQSELLGSINQNIKMPLAVEAKEIAEQAIVYLDIGEKKKALELFEKGHAKDSTNIVCLYNIALLKREWGEYKEVVHKMYIVYKLIEKSGGNNEMLKIIALELAKTHLQGGNIYLAVDWFDKVIVHDSNSLEPYMLKIRLLALVGDEIQLTIALNSFQEKMFTIDIPENILQKCKDVLDYIIIDDKSVKKKPIHQQICFLCNLIKMGRKDEKFMKTYVRIICRHSRMAMECGLGKEFKEDTKVRCLVENELNFLGNQGAPQKGDAGERFAKAYIGYIYGVGWGIIYQIIDKGLLIDKEYIKGVKEMQIDKKKQYMRGIKKRISGLGEGAYEILKKYLEDSPGSLLHL